MSVAEIVLGNLIEYYNLTNSCTCVYNFFKIGRNMLIKDIIILPFNKLNFRLIELFKFISTLIINNYYSNKLKLHLHGINLIHSLPKNITSAVISSI